MEARPNESKSMASMEDRELFERSLKNMGKWTMESLKKESDKDYPKNESKKLPPYIPPPYIQRGLIPLEAGKVTLLAGSSEDKVTELMVSIVASMVDTINLDESRYAREPGFDAFVRPDCATKSDDAILIFTLDKDDTYTKARLYMAMKEFRAYHKGDFSKVIGYDATKLITEHAHMACEEVRKTHNIRAVVINSLIHLLRCKEDGHAQPLTLHQAIYELGALAERFGVPVLGTFPSQSGAIPHETTHGIAADGEITTWVEPMMTLSDAIEPDNKAHQAADHVLFMKPDEDREYGYKIIRLK